MCSGRGSRQFASGVGFVAANAAYANVLPSDASGAIQLVTRAPTRYPKDRQALQGESVRESSSQHIPLRTTVDTWRWRRPVRRGNDVHRPFSTTSRLWTPTCKPDAKMRFANRKRDCGLQTAKGCLRDDQIPPCSRAIVPHAPMYSIVGKANPTCKNTCDGCGCRRGGHAGESRSAEDPSCGK